MGCPSDMPTAFITGLRGFTGQYLSAELESIGYQVFGSVYGEEGSGSQEFSIDLCDSYAVAECIKKVKPDVVAHLAAISFVSHGDVDEIYRTNVLGTRNLLKALADSEATPRAVLLASSANIYGNTTIDPITECTALSPMNDYAVSKVAMEYMAHLWMDRLPIIIARPFNYTGVGQSTNFLIPKIVDCFRRGDEVIELGNLDVARDFSDVRVVANAYVRLLQLVPAGETFNICSGEAVSLGAVLAMMAEIAGYSIQVRVNPAYVRANEVKSLRGSNQKLTKSIGKIDTIPLKQTLRWMYEASI